MTRRFLALTLAALVALPVLAQGGTAPSQTPPQNPPQAATGSSAPMLDCRSASWRVSLIAGTNTPPLLRLADSGTEFPAEISVTGLGITLRGTSRDPDFGLSLSLRRDGGATISVIPKGGERMSEEAICTGQPAFMASHGG